ncbi:hypothetical protein K435DRAFT_711091 [Dendrothele bispora CBS 962.96]|uniref:Uncharacterized protein n=1 Tax=Dendrothele bispora (strain CBS 962.96) TaxID=1314807 RepID=A0A4S8MVP6_DENBC|nr:hypothetical protein K435DRAFT_711091 [Dendrothele bispora CBS 962.96]
MTSKENKVFPPSGILKDLALLRASEIRLSSLLPNNASETGQDTPELERSYEFVREARAAIKVHDNDAVERQAERLENVRGGLEEVLKGLDQGR